MRQRQKPCEESGKDATVDLKNSHNLKVESVNSSRSVQVNSQAQRSMFKTVKVAMMQHQQSEWP